jgi:hypothetical protein
MFLRTKGHFQGMAELTRIIHKKAQTSCKSLIE